jgi:hypothetical protein
MRNKGFIVALAGASALLCAAANAQVADPRDTPSEIGFSVVDARPADDSITKTLSDQVTSCDDGIVRVGDDSSSTARLALLRQDIEDNLGGRVANTTLTVTRYRVYLNRSRQAIAAGKVAAPSCTRENTTAGWYDPEETTNFNSPIVVEISAVYLGRAFVARTVSSPSVEIAGVSALHDADASPAITAAMEKANLVLIARVRQALWGHESPRALSSERFELASN